jgi:hypothetical protein
LNHSRVGFGVGPLIFLRERAPPVLCGMDVRAKARTLQLQPTPLT